MNTAIRTSLALLLTAILAPFLLVAPAHAEEPEPVDPCASQTATWKEEAAYWKAAAHDEQERGSAREMAAVDRALQWEARALAYAEQLGTRTAERDRFRTQNNTLRAQRNRLQAKVAELRERLAAVAG